MTIDGPAKGQSGEEKECAALRVAEGVYMVSYLVASGGSGPGALPIPPHYE